MTARQKHAFFAQLEIGHADAAGRHFKLAVITFLAVLLFDLDDRQVSHDTLSSRPSLLALLLLCHLLLDVLNEVLEAHATFLAAQTHLLE